MSFVSPLISLTRRSPIQDVTSVSYELKLLNAMPQVTVMFADIVGFTSMSMNVEPEVVMDLLNELYTRYDTASLVGNVASFIRAWSLAHLRLNLTLGHDGLMVGGITGSECTNVIVRSQVAGISGFLRGIVECKSHWSCPGATVGHLLEPLSSS